MENTKYNIDLTEHRKRNPDNEWYFPVRMENSKGIVWVDNVLIALSRFKAPITQATWTNCLRRGVIDAATPEETAKLHNWWTEGWKYTPPLPEGWGSIPVARVAEQPLGKTLELVYPNLHTAAEAVQYDERALKRIMRHERANPWGNIELIPMRAIPANEPNLPWTLFAADGTIEGQFKNRLKMAEYLNTSPRTIDWAHSHNWNELSSGRWFWCDHWGLRPITPQDEILEWDWRRTRWPNYTPDEI